MQQHASAYPLTRLGLVAALLGLTAACGFVSDRLAALPLTRVATLPATQACDAPEEAQRRLTGAYLRQSDSSGLRYDTVLVSGRDTRNAPLGEITLNDRTQTREVQDARGTVFIGPEDAQTRPRPGFRFTDSLPNVYDVTYSIEAAGFSGPMVLGPGAVLAEIPTSGARVFAGRVALDLVTQDEEGRTTTTSATGRFSLQAGYGSAEGSFSASGFSAALPFDRLNWSGLALCGTRVISSGAGVVTVQTGNGPRVQPFKTDRAPAPLKALFEASQFPPEERPAPPGSVGGVFVIQSDNGTLTGVFLSDQPVVVEEPEDGDA